MLGICIHCAKFATNARFKRCVGPLRHTPYGKQSFIFLDMQLCTLLMSLVVTGFLSCGWPIVGTKFSEWVQIFQKNLFQGEPLFRGVQIKCDRHIHMLTIGSVLTTNVFQTNLCQLLFRATLKVRLDSSLIPRLSCVGREKRAWYTLFAHAQFSQDFWEFGNFP